MKLFPINSSFKKIFHSVYDNQTTPTHWHNLITVWDWKEWFIACVLLITGHSKPHAFHLTNDTATRQVVIRTKLYSSQEIWCAKPFVVLAGIPTGEFVIVIVNQIIHFNAFFHILGKPKSIPPAPLKTEIQMAFNSYCRKLDNGLFSDEELAEWETIFQNAASSDAYIPAPFPSLLSRTIPTIWLPNTSSAILDSDLIPTELASDESLVINPNTCGYHHEDVYVNDWIAVCPNQNAENIEDPFWFGQVISMDSTCVEVQWYVPNLQHKFKSNWKKHQNTSKIHQGTVICSMPETSYTPPHGLPIPFLFEICNKLSNFTMFGL
jgi:hypothetical protein